MTPSGAEGRREGPLTRVEAAQHRQLAALLRHVWTNSAFYREYYTGHGLRFEDLAHIAVRDLPFVTKSTLMEHFDAAVTDRRLRKRELEQWFEGHPGVRAVFHPDFVSLMSSGTSGTLGIFVYDQVGWRAMNNVVSSRLPGPEPRRAGRTRVAFYISTYRPSPALMTSRSMSPALYDGMVLSILDPPDHVAARLNAFQPHRVVGYSSAVATLAEWSLADRLRIAPRQIVVGSDRLTPSMEETIAAAWGAPVHLAYMASESVYIGIREPGDVELTLLDDLNIVEILDSGQRAVGPGESGRVVLTNLYNYALPIVRYDLGDEVVRGATGGHRAFGAIRDIQGRSAGTVPIVLDDGAHGTIPSVVLMQLTLSDLQRVQYVSKGPDHIRIDYVAPDDRDTAIGREFSRLLATLRAGRTTFSVRRVAEISPDPRTGKVQTIRMEWQPSSRPALASSPAPVRPSERVTPTNLFTAFPRAAIEQSVAARFEQQVVAHAERPAVVTDGHVLTYEGLNRRANRLARTLLARDSDGAGPIALLLSHGVPTIAAMLAVLKAGKMFVPLDPTFPRARLRAMIEDARATLIVTDAAHHDVAAVLAGRAERVFVADAVGASGLADNLALPIAPDAFAYILYTSGSTGEPRGVVQNHRNVLHNIMKYTNGAHLAADDRMTMLLSFSFSAAMTNAFGALLNGAALFPLDVRARGLAGLRALLRDSSLTILKAVPSVFRLVCDSLAVGERFPALRLVELVGEPVTPRDVARFRRHFPPPCLLHNRLGATEMHVIRQYFLDAETPITGGVVPVGYAVDDTDILILDADGQPLGENGLGEIAIRSPFLATGYWHRPELTRAAFTPDPAGGEARIYRTGDLGLLRADGCLEHHGRKDSQAKVRGQRIEVGEIERALLTIDSLAACAVLVREDRPDDARLVAYLVAASQPAPAAAVLRQALAASLPRYMIPSAFVWLAALPLAPTGKVDRSALPPPPSDPGRAEVPYIAPSTPLEERLAGIWAEILGLDRVGVHDDFFELGGHSLLAMQILSRAQEAFRIEVPMRRFFEAPTVAAQAMAIVEQWLEELVPADRDRMLADRGDNAQREQP